MFNLTYPTALALPGPSLLWSFLGAYLDDSPKFYPGDEKDPKKTLPYRFVTLVYRPFYAFGHARLAALLPQQGQQGIDLLPKANSGGQVDKTSYSHSDAFSAFSLQYNLNIGKRWVSEHTYATSVSEVSYDITQDAASGGTRIATVDGLLNIRELAGSLRFNIRAETLQPFIRLGYGWSWYRIKAPRLDGEPLKQWDDQWFHSPSAPFWPNMLVLGAGVEVLLLKDREFSMLSKTLTLGKPDLGIRLDFNLRSHKLGGDRPDGRQNTWIYRPELGFGVFLGF